MIPDNTAYATKIFLENYFTLGEEGIETPETISDLIIKGGYVMDIYIFFI